MSDTTMTTTHALACLQASHDALDQAQTETDAAKKKTLMRRAQLLAQVAAYILTVATAV